MQRKERCCCATVIHIVNYKVIKQTSLSFGIQSDPFNVFDKRNDVIVRGQKEFKRCDDKFD